jgi:hypothetical protein
LQYVLQKCSTRSVTELTVRKARQMLAAWAAGQDAVGSRRDGVVRAAIDAGLSKSAVHRLTGMARTTIDRIRRTDSRRGPAGRPGDLVTPATAVKPAPSWGSPVCRMRE